MKQILFLFATIVFATSLPAQAPFKPKAEAPAQPAEIDWVNLNFNLPATASSLPQRAPSLLSNSTLHLRKSLPIYLPGTPGVSIQRDRETDAIIALFGRPSDLPPAAPEKEDAYAYLATVAEDLGIEDPFNELILVDWKEDELGHIHVRVRQQFAGIPIGSADAWLHASSEQGFDRFTGRLVPTPQSLDIRPAKTEQYALDLVHEREAEKTVRLSGEQLKFIGGPQLSVELVIDFKVAENGIKQPGEYQLLYRVESRPNLTEHNTTDIDAQTGEIVNYYSNLCGFAGKMLSHVDHDHDHNDALPMKTTMMDGPAVANVQDLTGQFVQLNTYEENGTFFLVDATRDMFNQGGDGSLNGIILTFDGLGGSPQLESFDPVVGSSANNTDWSRTAASVHNNAGRSYQYFLDRHQRNSIDGIGGDVLSVMNVNETDGTEMDNAFWNGRALFYGNGNQAFIDLPIAVDVAGHEMGHGVIQATADLIYQEQPGALNESFADVFGYLVEGETGNFRIGEDAVNTQVFPSGTMRDMQNPNNGASGPGDFRWQPAHMDEYQNLPVNAENDNGGVHINSGIPNRAFFLFTTDPAVGDDRAERVYYRALDVYLTRSSRFADLRIAVVQAADDLFGADVVAAANAAFDAVGIGGSATDTEVDISTNPGDRFLLLSNVGQTALFLAQEDGTLLNNPLESVGLNSRPSITPNGARVILYKRKFVGTEIVKS
ncbi:MAG: M4 family metallopeptidase [Bacteroidota bacterium]